MQSIINEDVYAAGDCCSAHNWPKSETENWFQVFIMCKFKKVTASKLKKSQDGTKIYISYFVVS